GHPLQRRQHGVRPRRHHLGDPRPPRLRDVGRQRRAHGLRRVQPPADAEHGAVGEAGGEDGHERGNAGGHGPAGLPRWGAMFTERLAGRPSVTRPSHPASMPRTPLLLALLLSAASLLGACQGRLEDPDAIADRVAARAAENYAGVRDFTLHGDDLVIYFRRAGADSLATFEGRAFTDDSLREAVALPYHLPNAMELARGLRGNARLAGTADLDGERVYVLDAIDPAAVTGAETAIDSLRVLVDARTFQIREIRVAEPPPTDSAATPDPDAPPLVTRQRYGDFRTADG